MANNTEKAKKADLILISSISDDKKLFDIFQIYKEDLKQNYTELYYALLGWKDSHLNELNKVNIVSTNISNQSETIEEIISEIKVHQQRALYNADNAADGYDSGFYDGEDNAYSIVLDLFKKNNIYGKED